MSRSKVVHPKGVLDVFFASSLDGTEGCSVGAGVGVMASSVRGSLSMSAQRKDGGHLLTIGKGWQEEIPYRKKNAIKERPRWRGKKVREVNYFFFQE
jgi:hypothetical protein